MRSETTKAKLQQFMVELGKNVRTEGRVYLTGGATALMFDWRSMTIDVDLKAEPEPAGFFEAIAALKNQLDINIELASPDQFIPALPGWRERSLFIARHGLIEFFHYDPYAQALSKIQRGHERDMTDVAAMARDGLIDSEKLLKLYRDIEPQLLRYPAIDPEVFRLAVLKFCETER